MFHFHLYIFIQQPTYRNKFRLRHLLKLLLNIYVPIKEIYSVTDSSTLLFQLFSDVNNIQKFQKKSKIMDLSPDKRFANRLLVNKKLKDINEKKDGARKSIDYNVQEVNRRQIPPEGLFSGGRVSNLSSIVTEDDQEVARKRGDLLCLLSRQSPPSIETLFRTLEADHQKKK